MLPKSAKVVLVSSAVQDWSVEASFASRNANVEETSRQNTMAGAFPYSHMEIENQCLSPGGIFQDQISLLVLSSPTILGMRLWLSTLPRAPKIQPSPGVPDNSHLFV
jgi:hypothetical protein